MGLDYFFKTYSLELYDEQTDYNYNEIVY